MLICILFYFCRVFFSSIAVAFKKKINKKKFSWFLSLFLIILTKTICVFLFQGFYFTLLKETVSLSFFLIKLSRTQNNNDFLQRCLKFVLLHLHTQTVGIDRIYNYRPIENKDWYNVCLCSNYINWVKNLDIKISIIYITSMNPEFGLGMRWPHLTWLGKPNL